MISHRKRRTIHGRRSKKQGFRVQVPHEHRRTGVDRGSFDARSGQAGHCRPLAGRAGRKGRGADARARQVPRFGLTHHPRRGDVCRLDGQGRQGVDVFGGLFPRRGRRRAEQVRPVARKKARQRKNAEIHHGAGGLSVAGADDPALFPAADVSGRLYRPVYQERGGAQSGRIRHQARDLLRLHDPVLQAEGHLPRVPVPRRGA